MSLRGGKLQQNVVLPYQNSEDCEIANQMAILEHDKPLSRCTMERNILKASNVLHCQSYGRIYSDSKAHRYAAEGPPLHTLL